jgi:hypothetical protein
MKNEKSYCKECKKHVITCTCSDTKKKRKVCPSCHGAGISPLSIAIGSMICMQCGGTGEKL